MVAVPDVAKAFFPAPGDITAQMQGVDARLVQLQIPPEQQHELGGELTDGRVVQPRLTFLQVVHEHVTHRLAFDLIPVDEFGDRQLATAAGCVDRRG